MSRVVLEHVTKRFGSTVAVDDLSLEIESGQFFSLLGPSGCGKTTTMRLIAGLEIPDKGRIWIANKLVCDANTGTFVSPGKRGVGMVFQNYALWPHMTVRENILFGLKVRRLTGNEQLSRLERVLHRLQISELVDRFPNELSGGQQQRIALARELVTGSGLLLMDEPLSNLDAKLRVDMRVELKQLHEEGGGTIIYVTHDQLEALTLSSRMAIMQSGRVRQLGAPAEVFSLPSSLFVAEFMGNTPINLVEGVVTDSEIDLGGYRIPLPRRVESWKAGASIILGARPEELSLSQEAGGPWSVEAVVEAVLLMGYESLVRVRILHQDDPSQRSDITFTVSADERTRSFGTGDRCFVDFNEKLIHLFHAESGDRVA